MLDQVWTFLGDESNRNVLSWLGGGLVVVLGGLWAVARHFNKSRSDKAKSVKADRGSVAVGRDIRNSEIVSRGRRKK